METKSIGNYIVEYDEETHSYFINGQKAISVTTLIKWKKPKKYDGIDPSILKKAADYGTSVHYAIQVYEELGIGDGTIDELKDYCWLKRQYKWEVTSCEKFIIIEYKGIYIAGRLDLIINLNGERGIVDIKTTAELDKEYLAMQLNLYRLGYINTYNEPVNKIGYIWVRAKNKNDIKRKYGELWINEEGTYALLEEYYQYTQKELENSEVEK